MLTEDGQMRISAETDYGERGSVPTDPASQHIPSSTPIQCRSVPTDYTKNGNKSSLPNENRSVPTDDAKNPNKPTTSSKKAKHSVPTDAERKIKKLNKINRS